MAARKAARPAKSSPGGTRKRSGGGPASGAGTRGGSRPAALPAGLGPQVQAAAASLLQRVTEANAQDPASADELAMLLRAAERQVRDRFPSAH